MVRCDPVDQNGRALATTGGLERLDALVDQRVRLAIEDGYSARINARCTLGEALKDPRFLQDPSKHVALFSDHGVVHARDVARQILQVLEVAPGRLIPARAPERFAWMQAYGVLTAYVHDIGMIDLSPVGRAMHPEFATQAVLGPGFDAIVERLWDGGRSPLAARIVRLAASGHLTGSPQSALREMIAMANCHSKSKVPVALLNDPGRLRSAMRVAAGPSSGRSTGGSVVNRTRSHPHRRSREAARTPLPG